MADFPTDASTIQELQTATFDSLEGSTLIAIQNPTGTFNISLTEFLKAISNIQQISYGENRNQWQESIPIGALMYFGVSDVNLGFRNLGNWLPCNGQEIFETDYPIYFKISGNEGAGSVFLPDANDFTQTSSSNGYFLRGSNPNLSNNLRVQSDALQNITGDFWNLTSTGTQTGGGMGSANGAFQTLARQDDASQKADDITTIGHADGISFDASRVARTSNETRPKNIGAVLYIKLDNVF